jgi:hypothetical protein
MDARFSTADLAVVPDSLSAPLTIYVHFGEAEEIPEPHDNPDLKLELVRETGIPQQPAIFRPMGTAESAAGIPIYGSASSESRPGTPDARWTIPRRNKGPFFRISPPSANSPGFRLRAYVNYAGFSNGILLQF